MSKLYCLFLFNCEIAFKKNYIRWKSQDSKEIIK